MLKIGIAYTDITPTEPVWLVGYASRDRKSEGVYQSLTAGAISLVGGADEALILTADLIGYGPAYAASLKSLIVSATGLLPRQIILTATHTHCAPLFFRWAMPGAVETEYAEFLAQQLVRVTISARSNQVNGRMAFSRGRSEFGVNRRLPDGAGGVRFAPNPDGPMDKDLDTLWFSDMEGKLLGSLTSFGCHPTCRGGYLIGGDYPGFLCRALAEHTGAPAFFATGCAGNIRPWFRAEDGGFRTPEIAEVEMAGRKIAEDVMQTRDKAVSVDAHALRVENTFHPLPYITRPDRDSITRMAGEHEDPLMRQWASEMLWMIEAGGLPAHCPQEIQVLQFNENLRAVFLGGEVLTEIGVHIKRALAPSTTMTIAYSNGLIAYVAGRETHPLGGYEVEGSYRYYLRPAPFTEDAEDRIVATTMEIARGL